MAQNLFRKTPKNHPPPTKSTDCCQTEEMSTVTGYGFSQTSGLERYHSKDCELFEVLYCLRYRKHDILVTFVCSDVLPKKVTSL